MTWILQFLAKHWRETALVFLICALTLTISLSRTLYIKLKTENTELEIKLATQERNFATQVALAKEKEDEAAHRYAATVATLKDLHTKELVAVKDAAWKNYVARYGLGSIALGFTGGVSKPAHATGVRGTLPAPAFAGSTNAGAVTPDAKSGEQLVVESCARDASRLNQWIRLCELNQCEVKE